MSIKQRLQRRCNFPRHSQLYTGRAYCGFDEVVLTPRFGPSKGLKVRVGKMSGVAFYTLTGYWG